MGSEHRGKKFKLVIPVEDRQAKKPKKTFKNTSNEDKGALTTFRSKLSFQSWYENSYDNSTSSPSSVIPKSVVDEQKTKAEALLAKEIKVFQAGTSDLIPFLQN
jgi:hypothetical protein